MTFQPEVRISPVPVLAALLILALGFAFGVEFVSSPFETVDPVVSLFLIVAGLAVGAWFIYRWRPLVGRWATVLLLSALVHVVSLWLELPEALLLSVIPPALAAVLISLPAGAVAAVVESLLLIASLSLAVTGVRPAIVGVGLAGIWAVFGLMVAAYYPLESLSNWVEEYFERAQRLLEEGRDRKVELEQALEGLAHANRQLALANERTATLRIIAEEAQRAKTAFVASVSHEFRTPLNMIIGLVDLMVRSPGMYDVILSPKMREDLDVVHRNCLHLSSMVNDVLDLTRMEAGRLALHRERIRLEEIIERSVMAVRPLLDKKTLYLQTELAANLPEISCDRTRIQQVILNLVSNAARFTEQGGITVQAVREDQRLVVAVRDTGPGISPEDAERIFEPFWQGSGYLWRDRGGSGLGLSISKQFVELHGGRMWLESELGMGTSVFFTLPLAAPIEHIARPGHSIKGDWVWRERSFRAGGLMALEDLSRPRVVLCDAAGALYPRIIRQADQVELIHIRDPAQVAGAIDECPAHAVVLNLPADGDVLAPLRGVVQCVPDTPVLACSVPVEVKRAISAGALGHLIKPVTRADLERAIDAIGGPVRRVLVVDDDPDVLQLFTRMLHAGDPTLEVIAASSGRQALQELRLQPADLMLLDVVMPDMDGWEMLEAMHQDDHIADVPTFFVSAQDPADEPPASEFLIVAIEGGISLSKLLRCSLEMADLLLTPERGLDLAPG
jgi:signal transduction histidine kinase/CheY-like chemotaxis protein